MSSSRSNTEPTPIAAGASDLCHSATRRAWDIVEIRQAILECVSRDSLAKMMRVDKECSGDAARVLYRTIQYETMMKHLSGDTPRQQEYRALISIIEAPHYTVPPHLVEKHRIDEMRLRPGHLAVYHASIMRILLPFLQSQCPNIRKVIFGPSEDYRGNSLDIPEMDRWVIHFKPTIHAELVQTIKYPLSHPPPARIRPPDPPAAGCPLAYRFNLKLGWVGYPQRHRGVDEKWRISLRDSPHSANIYKKLDLADVRVTLGDLEAVYQRQTDAGHKVRLSEITARSSQPWLIPELLSFAQIASGSLTSLKLIRGYFHFPGKSMASFLDLPEIIHIVQSHLPNLETSHFALKGIDEAELACHPMLFDQDLSAGSGSVKELHIVTEDITTDLFNVVRACNPMLPPTGEISIRFETSGANASPWERTGSRVLQYIRQQPVHRRKHLQTVDFKTLDVMVPLDILSLRYREDGTPINLWEGRSRIWENKAKATASKGATLLPLLELAFADVGMKATRVRELKAADENASEILTEMEGLSAALAEVKRVTGMVQKLEILADVDEKAMAVYIRLLERKGRQERHDRLK